jgi:serine/threonine protein phosphatase PrpC
MVSNHLSKLCSAEQRLDSFKPLSEESKASEYHEVVPLKIKTAGYSIGKQPNNNEDAFFVSEKGFGVADGVSGWQDYGFSSHAFSNQLMDLCQRELEAQTQETYERASSKRKFRKQKRSFVNLETLDNDDINALDEQATAEGSPVSKNKSSPSVLAEIHPIYVLERAFQRVTSIGSSTAVLAIQNNNKLSVCNLGDSGF